MVGEDISIVKIMFGYFLSLYNEFFPISNYYCRLYELIVIST